MMVRLETMKQTSPLPQKISAITLLFIIQMMIQLLSAAHFFPSFLLIMALGL